MTTRTTGFSREAAYITVRQESSTPSELHACERCAADAEQSERSRASSLNVGSNSRSSPMEQQENTSARRTGHTSSGNTLNPVIANVAQLCQDNASSPPTSCASIRLKDGEELFSTGLIYSLRYPTSITLSPVDVRRWTLAAELFLETAVENGDCYPRGFQYNGSVTDRIRNMPPFDLDPYIGFGFCDEINFSELAVLNAAGILYGGLHALAWTAPFSSTAQRLLWRISSAFVMCFGPSVALVILVIACRHKIWTPLTGRPLGLCWRTTRLLGLIVFCAFMGYVVARAYLVIECFISLFDSPVGVYDVPAWSLYFPHIS